MDTRETSRGLLHMATVWTQATTHAFFDTMGVMNQLASDMADSLIDGLAPVQSGIHSRRLTTTTDMRTERTPILTQMSDSVTWAMQDAADVISRSAEQFNRASRTGGTVPPADSSSAARSGTTSSAPPADG